MTQQVDFAIITIREDEFEAVLERFPQKAQKGSSGRTYGIAQVKTQAGQNCTVAIVRCVEQGTDTAQRVASDVIADLDPQMLLVVGIAGGVPSDDFTLGDVIISSRINNFNVNKRYKDGTETFDMRGGIDPLISDIAASLPMYKYDQLANWSDSIKLNRPTVDLAQFNTDKFQKKITASTDKKVASWYEYLQTSVTDQFSSTRAPLFRTGTIASSNTMIRNVDLLVRWLQNAQSISAIEMEAAGVYQASQGIKKQYPVMAIRGISDIIGLDRDRQWTKYACQTAAAFAYAFITAGIVTPREVSTVVNASANTSSAGTQQATSSPAQSNNNEDGEKTLEVFISYAPEDEKFKLELEKHLKMLTRQKIIHAVHSENTGAGQVRNENIAQLIDAAQLVLLLVSQNFLASDQLYDYEMMHAMKRHETGAARVIPIILRPTDLTDTPFKDLQALPRYEKTIGTPSNDGAWSKVAMEIRDVCEQLRGQ